LGAAGPEHVGQGDGPQLVSSWADRPEVHRRG
jgi:hypothetical protein